MSKRILCTAAEAEDELRKRRKIKRVGYRVITRPHLPTSPTKFFPGMTSVKVTKAEFLSAIQDCLKYFEERGGRIELTVPESDYESFYIG